MTRINRVMNIAARILSIVFKLLAVVCLVFAGLSTNEVVEICTRNRYPPCSEYTQLYVLFLGGSLMLPLVLCVLLLGVSFLIDIWLAIRNQTKVIKQIDSKLLL